MTLTAQMALARARDATGLDDFGDPDFREGLERVLDAIPRMPLLAPVREAVEAKIIGDLATRLRIEAWHAAHPDTPPVEGMVLVCGLPRTGTTATVAMLALDPRLRFLRGWEAQAPLPPPEDGREAADPRRLAALEAAKAYAMRAMHLNDPDGPEEDLALLAGLTMSSYNGHLPMPEDYLDWWIARDFTGHYRFLERVLRLLHASRGPRRWLLKSPPHLFKLDAFAARFPDARYIWTHRDPARVISSAASLQSHMQAERSRPGSIEPAERGRMLLDFWRQGMDRGLAARARIGEARFIDVRNDDVVHQPVESFERIYAHLGLPLDEGLRRRLVDYNARNTPGAFGAHRHEPESFGLTHAEVRTAFADYVARFGL